MSNLQQPPGPDGPHIGRRGLLGGAAVVSALLLFPVRRALADLGVLNPEADLPPVAPPPVSGALPTSSAAVSPSASTTTTAPASVTPAVIGDPASYQTAQPVGPSGRWKLLAADDFTGSTLNPDLWWDGRYGTGSTGDVPFNATLEGEYFAASQVTVHESLLTLRCDPCPPKTFGDASYRYVSGCVTSSTDLRFEMPGTYIEARIRVPAVPWTWPAFWAVSDPGYTCEFDIFEFFGNDADPGRPWNDYHHSATGAGTADTQTGPFRYGTPGVDYRAAFHTFGLLATADTLTSYLDGVGQQPVKGQTVVSDHVQLMLNLSIYAKHAIPAGTTMDVDWVRIWKAS